MTKKQTDPCNDCGIETAPAHERDGTWEWVMYRPDVWAEAGMGKRGFLCVGCLELRLGRCLCADDISESDKSFLDTPRLLSRWEAKHSVPLENGQALTEHYIARVVRVQGWLGWNPEDGWLKRPKGKALGLDSPLLAQPNTNGKRQKSTVLNSRTSAK